MSLFRPHRTSPRRAAALAFAVVLLPDVGPTVRPAAAQVPEGGWDALEARNIGPAGMSGRVADVDVVLSDPDVIWVASATGGLFRSDDGGITWDPVFDDQGALGMGAVAVFQPNPDVVWAGMGEGNPRNSAGVGRGIYRSVDGGDTWTLLGLEDSERIHRIVLHPTDPDVAWVAAMGPAWNDGGQRGVYRTTDGGETWERVLSANDRTGAADLVMDPTNPDKLFAALWEYRRWPWFFESGGEGSGLFVTHDGGDTWREIGAADGVPAGPLGRIGLAIAPSDPDVVYALVEAEASELLRSDDGGRSWRTVSDEPGIAPRPFYYADLRVDPENENRIYSLHGAIQVSEDQGRTWRTVVPSRIVHGDVHELWIDPADPSHMIMGNDGGIAFTRDRGDNWRFVENLALAQFYRISLDDQHPFNVYGGMQDNGSWFGPSDVWENKGVLNAHWRRVGGGDGFHVEVDPTDPRYGYSMSQQGNLSRFDKVTGARKNIRPVHPEGEILRFNWNAGFAVDPDDGTLYLGSQFVHRSSDAGDTWEVISPDLTTDDPEKQRQDFSGGLTLDATGAENHTTITDIALSPLEEGVIWVGTDDGNVQLTTDGGATWTDVGEAIEGVPDFTYVTDVEPSHHDPATAYVTFDDHRRGNWETYVYRTTDRGRSWRRIADAGVDGFAHDLEEDPEVADLLFLGTEFGLHVSLDGGETWAKWTAGGLPPAPVRAVEVHPRDADLAVGTHGRAAWIVDDVRPLRALASDPGIRDADVHAFGPPPAYLHATAEAIGYRSTGMAMFQGRTRPYGALLSYWVGTDDAGSATVEVRDSGGRLIREIDGSAAPGVNRVVWGLDAGEEADSAAGVPPGAEVLPGTYRVLVRVGEEESATEVDVRLHPDAPETVADRRARLELMRVARRLDRVSDEAREQLAAAMKGLEAVVETLPGDADELAERTLALVDTLESAEERLFTGPDCQGICGDTGVPANDVRRPLFSLSGGWGTPSANQRLMMRQAHEALREIVGEVERIERQHLAPFRSALLDAGYTPLPEPGALTVPPGP